jgi:Prolipoprotein diacylglyceryltransferase
LRRYGKKFNGQIGALYIIGYGSGRIWIEGLRTDQLILGNTGLAVSQLVSGMLIVTGISIYIWKMNKRKEI